jgi:DNA-binding PadR family transcriptional regulator
VRVICHPNNVGELGPIGLEPDERSQPVCPGASGHWLTGIAIDMISYLYYSVNQMAKTDSLGVFEQVILTALLTLRDNAYGVTIREKAEKLAHPKAVSIGAVYVTLDRLEEKGLVSSWLSDPTPERGGRAKRCYRLEPAGRRALQEAAVTAKRIWDSTADAWGRNWARAK